MCGMIDYILTCLSTKPGAWCGVITSDSQWLRARMFPSTCSYGAETRRHLADAKRARVSRGTRDGAWSYQLQDPCQGPRNHRADVLHRAMSHLEVEQNHLKLIGCHTPEVHHISRPIQDDTLLLGISP